MAESESKSEVARLMQQITLEYEAAKRGMSGLAAGTARHDFIIARMEQGAERVLQLLREGKKAEARVLMCIDPWGIEEREIPNG